MSLNEELEQINERLRNSERRFRMLADNVPAHFAYVDAERRYRYVNKGFADLSSMPVNELVGRPMWEVIGEQAYAQAKSHVDEVLSGREQEFERSQALDDDGERWFLVRYVPDSDENGSVVGFYALLTEITERRAAERALQENRDRLAAIVNTAADALVTVDAEGAIESFNPAAERMFGYSAKEAIGRNVTLLMLEPYSGAQKARLPSYFAPRDAGMDASCELEARRKDGSTFPVDLAVSEIGHLRLFSAVIRDTSRRKQFEAEIARSHEALRSLSARLLKAEESERRRISRELHDDFSQRLAMLSVAIESLKAVEATPETLQRLRSMGSTVTEIAEDLHRLAYSLHPSILDHLGLSAALRRYAADVSAHQGIEVVLRERGFPQALDAAKSSCLYRIAQEALTNVARHSKSPLARVWLVGGSRAVRLSVRDLGEGFDVKNTRRHADTLGLVSMEERAHLLGGTLTIRSSPGKGTVVRATCPLE